MSTPCIITLAITGSLPGKKDNPAVPILFEEQVESTREAPTSSPERFAKVLEGIRKHCPGAPSNAAAMPAEARRMLRL